MSSPSTHTALSTQASSASAPAADKRAIHQPVGYEAITDEEKLINRRVNRRLDIALLPLLSLLYLFNGLDRGNVGNAQTQGFTDDIGASADDLNDAVSLFYVTFVIFQPFSAAVGRWMGPRHWIPLMMIGWGVVTIAQAWVSGRGSLIATRLLIGAFEAGFYPTTVAYLSTFYPRFDLAVRLGLFYGQYAVAGAFSGAISYGVFRLPAPILRTWQYLFILEGALTVFFALLAWIWLPSRPGSAWFLPRADRVFAGERMRADSAMYVAHTNEKNGIDEVKLSWRDVVETARDWKLWFVLVFNICASVPSAAFSVFLPLVVQGLGYESIHANLMCVPPYVCGAAGLYMFALSSDHHRERGYHIVSGIVIALIGLIVVVTVGSPVAKYAGLCVFLFGSYVSAPLTVAWLSGNTPEAGKRSLVLGINGWGNLAGVIGSQLYRRQYAPSYQVPFYATLGFVSVALVGYLAYRLTLQRVNRRRLRVIALMTEDEIAHERDDATRYSDRKRTFVYGL